jgi:hypothetical protein
MPTKLDERPSPSKRKGNAACFSMRPISAIRRSTIAAAALAALALTGCSGTQEAARQAGDQVGQAAKDAATTTGQAAKDAAATTGEAAKTAATATGQAALGQAVTPVLDLLKKSEGEVKAGNLAAAIASMGGFMGLWNTAAPIIKPLAGDKWPLINTAANLVLSTFAKGATPTPATASSALTGLIGPLSALLVK